MSKNLIKKGIVCLGGYDLTGDMNAVAATYGVQALDATVLGNNSRNFQGGLKTTKVAVSGFWDPNNDGGVFADISLTDILTFGFNNAEGGICFSQKGMQAQYTLPGGDVGKLIPFKLQAEAAGDLIRSTLVANKTGIGATGNGTGFQLGAVSAAQAVYASLHVTSVGGTGTPTLTGVIQSSPDDATWTTRLTFTAATAIGAQQLSLAGANTDTWWRIGYTISGSSPLFNFVAAVGIQ